MFTRLRHDIRAILERDPAARNAWTVLTCYPGLHAIVAHRLAHWCWLHGLKWLGRYVSYLARIVTGIEIHPGAVVGRRVFIDHGFGVVVGETAVIGNDCTIYQGVTLGGTSLAAGHKRHPTLERGVIVGAGAKVLGAFTVGEYAKIGSNAVLLKPVPAGATAVGNPARIVSREQQAAEGRPAAPAFAAYGVTPNGADPLSKTLQGLIAQSAAQEEQIVRIMALLRERGLDRQGLDMAGDDADRLNRLVD
ncbi:serine O-acetyltransferase [Pseudoduganella plicata]|uniref:Serine acetyltransferase n=1 Tax=Pseudoduganella plicata TaxID=321984 RepID=A0A4P7BNB6_9BURK|nr:serine O-acetyltransferase [Pseudoduganella plicata]QBQ39179.1 serine O-acetyltransferase [Pseudoduganella plicata]GGY87991.1 serine acetyltransferase [Pseudoduganella plicata]